MCPSADESHRDELTKLLGELSESPDQNGKIRLFELLYDELHRMASGLIYPSGRHRTVTPTVLVHEAYVHLGGGDQIRWQDRAHFFCIAARAMRQVLARYSERASAQKRGGGWQRVTLQTAIERPDQAFEFVELNDVLEKLSAEHERMGKVSELKIFAGMSSREIAEVLGVSRRTVETDWSLARKWLSRELG